MIITRPSKIIFWLIVALTLLLGAGQLILETVRGEPSALIINEFLAANQTGLVDEDGDYSDWIEIYNSGDTALNLSGWSLTDDPNQLEKWPFPNITLNSREYLIVFASGKDRKSAEPNTPLHTNFRLNQQGEYLALYNVLDGRIVDAFKPRFLEQFADVAYGRHPNHPKFVYLSTPTPGEPNSGSAVWRDTVAPVKFSAQRGFHDMPFTLTLTTTTPGAMIRYTTNGSQPTPDNGLTYVEPIPVNSTSFIRAAAFKDELLPAETTTHTYIFLDTVLSQPSLPPGLPDTWGNHEIDFAGHTKGSKVEADYEMDPDVVNDPKYGPALHEALLSIPSLSLVTAVSNFDIYANPRKRGVNWERPVSVEFIDPTGRYTGFQVNAGIRIQGGAGRWEFIPKHSFRLFFKEVYGPTKLRYPLFPNSPVDNFDTLILRAGVDRSFAGHPDTGDQRLTTYTRDEWLRASQSAMSGVGVHGIFVHLYINGLYWGLYNVVERPDASFAASYFGGDKEDWYAVSHSGPVSGEDERFDMLLSLASAGGLEDPEQYNRIRSYIDTAAFSDYIILNWYAGNKDWPHNNWYVVGRSEKGPARYFVWDGEFIWIDGATLYLGRADVTGLTNTIKPLFLALMENPDFEIEFADRLYKHLFNDGALTDVNAQLRWLEINQAIEQAVVAETARWGDARYEGPITLEDWLKARDDVLAQMEGNAARLVGLVREAGYYPDIDPPVFNQPGGPAAPEFELKMAADRGEIYYTTNGSDPRAAGRGEIASSAIMYQNPIILTTTTRIKARARVDETWSAMNEAAFKLPKNNPSGGVEITEIMYNPSDGNDYEFIELKNLSDVELDVAGLYFDQGITFTFPPGLAPLKPEEHIVLVRNPAAFSERYPDTPIAGAYQGKLSNQGERLVLKDARGNAVLSLAYDDENGWPVSADGWGDSLVFENLGGDRNDPQNWRASLDLNGSPGMEEGQNR